MDNRFLGGLLLIVGTSIGGGILAIPMATAGLGFLSSSLLLLAIWAVMTFSAYLILEVNLCLPEGAHLISMAKATLGPWGEMLMWLSYLLLLYALLAAFTSGGSDLIYTLTTALHFTCKTWLNALIFLIIFGAIVVTGIRGIDIANRILLSLKLLSFLLVVVFCLHLIQGNLLTQTHLAGLAGGVMPVITSFGFAIIMPSLRVYLRSDVAKLRRVIFWGSLIPLVCYLIWNSVVQGAIAAEALAGFAQSNHAVASLTMTLSQLTHNLWISQVVHLFTIICITTSFLGVSLCLVDFLRDGLRLRAPRHRVLWPILLAFLPPWMLVSLAPGIFIKALAYAGIACVVLLMLLPGLMAYRGRYHLPLKHPYTLLGGKGLLVFQILISLALLAFAACQV